jgi:hypothetical protein
VRCGRIAEPFEIVALAAPATAIASGAGGARRGSLVENGVERASALDRHVDRREGA